MTDSSAPSHDPFRGLDLISAEESLLLVVDMQERLLPHIEDAESVRRQCRLLLKAAPVFGVPIRLSEQYPRGLGRTDARLLEAAGECEPVEKLRFSAAEATGWPRAAERDDGRGWVVLAGIETHICVLQTTLDLLSWGYRVAVVADAVGSQRPTDHETAIARLRDAGATITTTESVLFEWCEQAGTERFRELRGVLRDNQNE